MDVNEFKELPILGILRGVEADTIGPLVETVFSSGLRTVEIAMNTPYAAGLISQMVRVSGGRLTIGAGTVLSMDDLKKALGAGASFVVSPVLVSEVVEYCAKNKIPVFPGALTPSEIYRAWACGAAMVKVFPAKFFGPGYFKEIKGPFREIELLACGGIKPENIRQFFSCGASAVAFGGSVFRKEWLANGDFSSIKESIKALINSYRRH